MTKKWYFWVTALIITSIIVLWPLLRPGFYISDDGEWMIIRLTAFYQSLSQGQFPVRWLSRLNYSYGYPVANFLYPGFMYLGSLLHIMGLSYVASIKAIMISSVITTSIVLFFALKKRFNEFNSYIGTLGFLFAPYLSYDMFKRGSVGEILAFFPASLLLYGHMHKIRWLVPLAVAFIIISHNTLALLFLSVFFFVYIYDGKITKSIIPVLLGLGMSAFFWIPALIERSFVKFTTTPVSEPSHYFIGMENIVLLGIPTIIALVYTRRKTLFFIITVCSFLLTFALSELLWKYTLLQTYIQFPFRFLAIPALLGPLFIAELFQKIPKRKRYVYFIVFVCLWIVGIYSIQKNISYVNREEGFYTTNEATTTVQNEYMPKWVIKNPTIRPVSVVELVSGDAKVIPRTIATQNIDITVLANVATTIQINTIYYPGWGVTIDGMLTPVNHNNPMGLMWINVPQGSHRVVAQFRETIPRFFADIITVISIIMYVVSMRYLRNIHEKK